MITLKQLACLSGFTLHIPTMTLVTRGYAVAKEGHTIKLPQYIYDQVAKSIIGKAIDHAVSNGDDWLGKWTDDTGHVWIEPTDVFTGLDEAMLWGLDRDQIAIFDLSDGNEIKINVSLENTPFAWCTE